MVSLLGSIDSSIKTFLNQIFESVGIAGFLAIILGVEALFILLFAIKTVFSYEARLKRSLDKLNKWLFTNKKIDENNIAEFNALVKKGPKRLVYYWQQYILYRDGGPANYLTEENVIEKPLKTSSWKNNIRNLMLLTGVWSVISLILGFATQPTQAFSAQVVAYALIYPALVLLLGCIAVFFIKGKRVINLDDIYHMYHLFSRFLTNACAELTPYIDFDLLFTAKEIENGNPQLREYYEQRARKAKEEFETAKKNEVKPSDFNFENVGVDGALLLDRAMKESEIYINKRTTTLSQIAQVEAQKDALRRNYENVQMDLQRKIQASKENIQKLIEQQAATTSRIEVGLLKQQQDKEISKQASLQKDYDQEESRYKSSKEELDKEIERLNVILKDCLEVATKGMVSEYHSFFEKVMRSAYKVAEKKVIDEKNDLVKERDKNEEELINVQTQIKRLMDENVTLRSRLEKYDPEYQQNTQTPEGHYDEKGNFIYADGSYHDTEGLFHDVDGKVYDMNGVLVSKDENPEQIKEKEEKQIVEDQINQFGSYVSEDQLNKEMPTETETEKPATPVENKFEEIVAKPDVDNSLERLIEDAVTKDETANVEEKKESDLPEVKEESKPQEEAKPEEVKQEETVEKPEETVAPKRGRGRPRKTETAEKVEEKSTEPKRGRGRPRKTESTEKPEKEEAPKSEKEESSPKRGRGRPRKTETAEKAEEKPAEPKRGRGRPKKVQPVNEENTDSISKINDMINDEEEKLNDMKEKINSQIDEALNSENLSEIDKEKDEIMKSIEALQEQANNAKANGESEEELSKINQRLDDLIKQLASLNENK